MNAKPKAPRHKRARIQFEFDHVEALPLMEYTEKLILQYAQMTLSDDPMLRKGGRAGIREIAKFCVAGQFYLNDQKNKSQSKRTTLEDSEGERTSLVATIERLDDDSKPAALWGRYISELDRLGLHPKTDKLEVVFDGGKTTKNAFRATLNRIRRKKQTKNET